MPAWLLTSATGLVLPAVNGTSSLFGARTNFSTTDLCHERSSGGPASDFSALDFYLPRPFLAYRGDGIFSKLLITLASEKASFTQAEAMVGISAEGGSTQMLPFSSPPEWRWRC